MPTVLGEKYDLAYLGIPPMMSQEDFKIWQIWKHKIKENFEGVYFNVHVGDGIDPGENVDEKFKRFWVQKTQLRIDVLVVYPDRVEIVELRHNASTSAIGRVLAYRDLYEFDDPFKLPVFLRIVSDFHNEVVARVAWKYNIFYEVI